jgi:hypothetical protein
MKVVARTTLTFLILLAIAVMVWMVSRDDGARPRIQTPVSERSVEPDSELANAPTRSPVVAPRRLADSTRAAVSPLQVPRTSEEGRSPLADRLHAPDHSGVEDLAIVLNLFTHYRTRFEGYPVGEDNATFVNALTGSNPGRLAFISRDHPAIDAQGRLLDRWGEPFFFHLLGRDQLEIRSAGPDRELYTTDDLLIASPAVRNAVLGSESR